MIPPQFSYLRPRTVDEAVAALGTYDDAKLLAGGQSLLPVLRLRLAAPEVVIDLGRTAGMRGVCEQDDAIVIGAMTTHYEVMHSSLVRRHCGLLAGATATVADPQVRHRGTLGGALAHADPAGDLPAVALALDATLVITGPAGQRSVPAAGFFQDYMQTALDTHEVLTEIRLPKLDSGWGYRYEKFHRVAQAWAIVAVAALVHRSGGQIAEARVGLTNMGATPLRAAATEAALTGAAATADAVGDAAALAADGTKPGSDLSGRSDYRQHLARVLTTQAVMAAARI